MDLSLNQKMLYLDLLLETLIDAKGSAYGPTNVDPKHWADVIKEGDPAVAEALNKLDTLQDVLLAYALTARQITDELTKGD